MVKRSVAFILLSALLVFGLEFFGPDGMYAFGGHGQTLSTISKITTGILAVTHVILAWVMWHKRGHWKPSEAAMFRFIAFKAIFWSWLAYTVRIREAGISLPYFATLVMMLLVTIELDIKLFARYVLGREDGPERATLYDNESRITEDIV